MNSKIKLDDRKLIEEILGAPFEEILKKAESNLRRVGCSEKGMQFLLNDDTGIVSAYKCNYGSFAKYFGTDLEGYVTEYMTTD